MDGRNVVVEILAERVEQIGLFKDWCQFYLEIAGLTLDVSEFCIENHGFSKQSKLSAVVYCPIEHLDRAWQMGQKAALVIHQGSTKRYHHGILVMEENALGIKTLDGYIASNG